ncbi:MAG: hypothetical protein LBU32_25770 [Clostridiales bacterium]|jgi:hypothetical protein|nr:hypothetical protein [Clostridiales bacterium]
MIDRSGLAKWADGALKAELRGKEAELRAKEAELRKIEEELKEKEEISKIYSLHILTHSPESIAQELKLTLDEVNSVLGGIFQESDP